MAKRVKSAEKRKDLVAAYKDRCLMNGNDKGKNGKVVDVEARNFMNVEMYVNDFKCRKQGKSDIMKKINGKMCKFEVKTGCGVLCENLEAGDIVSQLLAGADYVLYVDEYAPALPIERQLRVFTRSEFLGMLENYSSKGIGTWLKVAERDGAVKVNIQEFRNSNKKWEYLLDTMEEYPTLDEFMEMVGA